MIKIACKKRLNGAGGEFTLDADFCFKKGEFVALYGASGAGKSTILRLIAGFETPEEGRISAGERVFFDSDAGVNLAAQRRNVGFLFQDYALFENMNVLENLLFAAKDRALAAKLLEICELGGLEKASISRLSGGQKQRVALARALMRRPEILLLDEPLSALDNSMRGKLQEHLAALHAEFGISAIIVSHDVSEIYRLAARVFEIEGGKIAREGMPDEIFLQRAGSQKLAFNGKILSIKRADAAYVALAQVGHQLCEVVLSAAEARGLGEGSEVVVSAKAFNMTLKKREK